MRARASSVAATIVAIGLAALAPTIPPAVAAPAVKGSLQLSDSTVLPASPVTMTGSLPPRRSRTVKLQTKVSGTWKTLTTKKSSGAGAFSFATTSASAAGNRQYRVLAPAATLGGKRFAAVVTPTRTLTVVAVTAVDAGWHHACALGSDRRAWCWGSNEYGELGDGKGTPYEHGNKRISGPSQVLGGNWAGLSTVGATTCGRKRDATAWCWGENANVLTGLEGQVGQIPSPTQVAGSWSQIATGWAHACGVKTDGTGWCWGADRGQLGTDEPVPAGTKIKLPGTWLEIVPGGTGGWDGAGYVEVTCGIKADRSAWCWGSNGQGQLGDGSTHESAVPVAVDGSRSWAELSVGGYHTCGTTTDAKAWCWGANLDGRVGDGTFTDRHAPTQVTMAEGWKTVDAGLQHTCGVTSSGAGWCWGWNDQGQRGDGTTETGYWPAPLPHELTGTWRDISAGHQSSAGVKAPGTAWAWGLATSGETGQGASSAATSPVLVPVNP